MNQNLEVIRQILSLLETIEEGMEHIKKQLSELRYEESFIILKDAISGIISIESAMASMEKELPENRLDVLAAVLNKTMDNVVGSYEQGREDSVEGLMKEKLLPDFRAWKSEIEKLLRPYVVF